MPFEIESTHFLHFHGFDREWVNCGLSDDELRFLQILLAAAPLHWPIVKGTGGLRKARFAPAGLGRGKSSAYRVGYVHLPQRRAIVLVTVWGKNEKANISPAERSALAKAIREVERALGLRNKHEQEED